MGIYLPRNTDEQANTAGVRTLLEGLDKAQRVILDAPVADVVPAVRCQDCVYARPLEDMKYDYLCHYWNGHSCNQNQFCSQGKRKEDI